MTWRARRRARQRRKALSLLLPGWSDPGDEQEVMLLAVSLPKALLTRDPEDFGKRADACNVAIHQASIAAAQTIKQDWPVRWPDHMGDKFKEGWKGIARY